MRRQKTTSELRTRVIFAAQRYLDRPIYRVISDRTAVSLVVSGAFEPERNVPTLPARIMEVDHYDRVRLRWVAPDGKGGLVPK